MNRLGFVLICIAILIKTSLKAQNTSNFNNLIESGNFKLLESEFKEKYSSSDLAYLNFLRATASSYSNNKLNGVAVSIMKYCCDWYQNSNECDTIKLNNLHLLGRYYSFANESELSLQTNQICLTKRLSCKNTNPIDIAKSYNNIGLYYWDKKIDDTSLVYFTKAFNFNKKGGCKNVLFTNTLYTNYLLNLTFLGEIKKGQRLINSWCKLAETRDDLTKIKRQVNRNIYECLIAKNIAGAFSYHAINEKIIKNQFRNNSLELFEYRYNFASELAKQNYDELALNYLRKIVKKDINKLPLYEQLKARSSVGTALMNLEYDEEALKIYTDLKPQFLENYIDSTSSMLLLSNLSLCYKKLGQFDLMKSTRLDLLNRIEKNISNTELHWIYEKNLDRDIRFFYDMEDFDNYEQSIIKYINFFNQIKNVDKELLWILKLSNLYLFQKVDIDKSKKLLEDVENKLPKAKNNKEVSGYYYYYKAEFERRTGSTNKYFFYKLAVDCFDSIQYFPVEYENALKAYAQQILALGDIELGKELMDRYLEFGSKDTNNLEYFNYKIYYLNTLKEYQSDEESNKNAIELFNRIERLFGIDNATYRRAAKFLNDCIIESDFRKKIISNWILSFKNKDNLDFFIANSALANFYFEEGELSKCDSIGNFFIKEAEVLNNYDYNEVAKFYIQNLTSNLGKGYQESIDILNKIGIGMYDFDKDGNKYYFNCLMGLQDFDKAFIYLKKKEEFILFNYSKKSELYQALLSDFINYFNKTSNSNLEKYYRELELDWFYENQSTNKTQIVSKATNLVSFLNSNFDLYERSLFLINRTKNSFNINIETSANLNDLFLLTLENICSTNLFLLGLSQDYNLDSSTLLIEKIKTLKDQSLTKENTLFANLLLNILESISQYIKNPNSDSLNDFSASIYNFQYGNNMILKEDEAMFEIRKLISEGKLEEAKIKSEKTNNLALSEEIVWNEGDYFNAFNYRFKKEIIDIDKIIKSSKSLTEVELDQTREIQKNGLNFCLGRYLLYGQDQENAILRNEIKRKNFELILNNYGVLSDLNKDFYRYIRNTDLLFKNQYYYLAKLKNQGLLNQNENKLPYELLSDLEYKLNIRLVERESINTSWISFDDIKRSLNDTSVFVLNYKYYYKGFADEKIEKPINETYYLTFIISSDSFSPILLIDSLSNENEQDIMDYYFNGITRKSEKQDLSFVYEKIWSKIDKQLPNKVKKVILSPDGMYNSVNVSTLFDKKNNKYILEKYQIVIADKIGTKRDENIKEKFSNINSAVLLGFPNYSGQTFSNDQSSSDSLKINLDKYYSNATRGTIAKSLPGTKIEIEKINTLFTQRGINTTVLTENNATEDNLKRIVNPDVLHIATHGFFINSKDGMPMFNSGLLLAGSNSKTKKIEDGYLSAYETSLLNLENTKLVVLSACETGRGVLKDGDGVFGLKQGCLNAGAQNIIMSLWKVDDKVTQEFMSRFYEIWLNEKTSIREAFNKAQVEIKAKYPQPYYWGAFILVGE